MKTIIVGGDCFWGVEEYYKRLKGVLTTEVGYAQGSKENPTYEEVCSGKFEHIEVVKIQYDDTILSLEKILEHLFRIIDPTSIDKQANDVGIQYRSGVYFSDDSEETVIKNYINSQQQNYSKPIVVEVDKLQNYYPAEEYHQKYLVKNKNGYCHVNFDKIKPDEKK